jgi:hypothetical protein
MTMHGFAHAHANVIGAREADESQYSQPMVAEVITAHRVAREAAPKRRRPQKLRVS